MPQTDPTQGVPALTPSLSIVPRQPLPPSPSPVPSIGKPNPNWRGLLLRSGSEGDGAVLPCLANIRTALSLSPEWHGVLAYNSSTCYVTARSSPPWSSSQSSPRPTPFQWTDEDNIRTADWLQHQGIMVSTQLVREAVYISSQERPFHPIRDYISSLEGRWDGSPRLDYWLSIYMGVEHTEYSAAVGSRFLLGAIARVLSPGVKHDHCLVLEGGQGYGKSTALNVLAGDWFTDDMSSLGSKDSVMQSRGVWIVELAELAALDKADPLKVKAFLSRRVDRIRLPYGRITVELPRECVFAGSVNPDTYLRDETGNRRYWPVRCGQASIYDLTQDRDQIWAEALTAYRSGRKWWLDSQRLINMAEEEQEERFETDAWSSKISSFVSGKETTTSSEILLSCIGKETKDQSKSDQQRVSHVMRSLHWFSHRHQDLPGRPYFYVRSLKASPRRN